MRVTREAQLPSRVRIFMKFIINGFIPASVYAGFMRFPLITTNHQRLANFIIKGSEVLTTCL